MHGMHDGSAVQHLVIRCVAGYILGIETNDGSDPPILLKRMRTMSAIDTLHAPAIARPANIFSRLALAVMDWNNARTTRDALYRLTDRELDDIGLNRSDIDRVARGL